MFPVRACTVGLREPAGAIATFGDTPGPEAAAAIEHAINGPPETGKRLTVDEHHAISVVLGVGPERHGAFYIGLGRGSSEPVSALACQLLEALAAQASRSLADPEPERPEDSRYYDELCRLVLDNVGLEPLMRRCAEIGGGPIGITDMRGALVAGDAVPPNVGEIPLEVGGTPMGRLVLSAPALRSPARPAIVLAATLELSKWKSAFELERDLRGDALESFLRAPNDPLETAARGRLVGIDPARPYVPVLLSFEVSRITEERGSIALRSILTTIHRRFGPPPSAVSFVRPDGILVLVDPGATVGPLPGAVAEVLTSIRTATPCAAASAGVGPPASDPAGYDSAIRQAQLAADFGRRLAVSAPINASQLGAFRLLLAIADRRRLEEFVSDHLGSLIQHDTIHGTDFVRTLEAFYVCGEKPRPAAAALYVHVNTLKYRLTRIAAVSGRDIGAMSERFNMYLALYALRLLQPERETLLTTEKPFAVAL